MITAVDSSILIDVFIADPQFGVSSARTLSRCLNEGAVIVCGIVLTETMPLFNSVDEFLQVLGTLNVKPADISIASYMHAGSAWRSYRLAGGTRKRVVADFIIGAHAANESDRLLTRDRGFYRKYFCKLKVLEPS